MIKVEVKQYNSHEIATAFHDVGGKDVVIFCHGYRGTSVGPSRHFVRVADRLAKQGISSLRFDQYCSGNSEGDFYDSSFNDWVSTTKTIVDDYLGQGYRVALFGQSMGGATVICVGASISELTAMVAWVPDPNVDTFRDLNSKYIEEGGQRVQVAYWLEAHEAGVEDRLPSVQAPAYIVQCTADEYVDQQNRDAISNNAQSNHQVDIFEGYPHSSWSYDQADDIINKSVNFLVRSFGR
jgi:esterase/lipase